MKRWLLSGQYRQTGSTAQYSMRAFGLVLNFLGLDRIRHVELLQFQVAFINTGLSTCAQTGDYVQ